LIKKCPRSYVSEFAKRVLDKQKPEYLELFLGMTENSHLYGSRALSIENEICSFITSREWKKTVLRWCSSKDSTEFNQRKQEMLTCTRTVLTLSTSSNSGDEENANNTRVTVTPDGERPVLDDDLTSSLQFHMKILILLTNCNLGPRLYAIYPIHHVVAGVLDRATVFPIRRELCHLLICMLKTSIDRAEKLEGFWELLEIILHSFDALPNDLIRISKNPFLRIQNGQWLELSAGIISTFFESFDVFAFTAANSSSSTPGQRKPSATSTIDPKFLMQKLFHSIRNLIEHHSDKLGTALREELHYASMIIHRQLVEIGEEEEIVAAMDADTSRPNGNNNNGVDVDIIETKLQVLRMQHQRNSVVFADVQQALTRKQLKLFLSLLKESSLSSSSSSTASALPNSSSSRSSNSNGFNNLRKDKNKDRLRSTTSDEDDIILFFKSIPRINDSRNRNLPNISSSTSSSIDRNDTIRFEPLIKKLANHFRSMISKSALSRSLENDSIRTCGWILKSFRLMIEEYLPFDCDKIHEMSFSSLLNATGSTASGSSSSTDSNLSELNELRTVFNENGVVLLCMELIAVGIDHSISIEAIKLLISLLYNSGGIPAIQSTIYRYLLGTDSFLFFELMKEMIENLKDWNLKENDRVSASSSSSSSSSSPLFLNDKSSITRIPEDILVLYLLQGICEGSFLPIRNQLREQVGNAKVVNLLEILSSYLSLLSLNIASSLCNIYLAITLLKTIQRLVQGPCKGNQEQFVLHTELLISLNRIIREMRKAPSSSISSSLFHSNATTSATAMAIKTSVGRKFSMAAAVIGKGGSNNGIGGGVGTMAIDPTHYYQKDLFHYNERLKEGIIDVIRVLIEGHYESSLLFDRVSTTVDLNVLHLLLFPPSIDSSASKASSNDSSSSSAASSREMTAGQSKYLGLIKQFSKTVDTFQGEEQILSLREEIASIEVVFNSQVHIVYFHVPSFIQDISMESKSRVIEEVKNNETVGGGSRELKLNDFVRQCRKLYR
jgi:hypothetical protein